jgi:hypothetical protein
MNRFRRPKFRPLAPYLITLTVAYAIGMVALHLAYTRELERHYDYFLYLTNMYCQANLKGPPGALFFGEPK